MGWVVMSERELGRIEVLSRVVENRISVTHAAEVLGLSSRQVQRLLRTFRVQGAWAALALLRRDKSTLRCGF